MSTGDSSSNKGPRNIGVVVVHSRGREARYEALTALVSGFYETLCTRKSAKDRSDCPRLQVETSELYRVTPRPREVSDLAPPPTGVTSGGSPASLFRPASITIPKTEDSIRFYEVYWPDSDFQFSAYEKLKYNLWLITTLWNPLFNLSRYRKTYGAPQTSRLGAVARFAKSYAALFTFGFVYHLSELPFLLLALAFRKTKPLSRMGHGIYDYAGDLKRYASQDRLFHDQTKKDVILARFDETFAKAYLENDEIHFIGDGFGSVILYDGLTRHPVHPSKMSEPFRAYLTESWTRWDAKTDKREDDRDSPSQPIDLGKKLKTVITLGGPLDRFYLVWPSRRDVHPQPVFRFERKKDEPLRWTAKAVPAEASADVDAKWFHFYESADPLGERLEHFENGRLPRPESRCLANWFYPSRARDSYWRNEDLMRWLVGRVYSQTEHDQTPVAPPPEAAPSSRFWRFGLHAILACATAVIGIRYVLVSGTNFTIRLLHDFYEDAESDTIFSWLAWTDQVLVAVWKVLGFGGSWVDLVYGLGGLALALLATSFFLSLHYYRRSEAAHERRLEKIGLR